MSEPEVAAAKGRRARERMVSLYSPEVLGRTIAAEYDRIRQMLRCVCVWKGQEGCYQGRYMEVHC
jgi:hypothetical protein